MSMFDISVLLYRPERMTPTRDSNEADEDRPLPPKTSLVTYALNPPVLNPFLIKPATTPRIRAAVSPPDLSVSRAARSILNVSYPSEWRVIVLSETADAMASESMLSDAARTCPRWWSVWFPPISLLPAAEKI